MLGSGGAVSIRNLFIGVKGGVAEIAENRTVVVVGARLGDHVDSSALRAAVFSGEALRTDLEFLNSLKRHLHYRTANGVVFVVYPVNRGIHITAVGTVNGKDGVAILGRIV